MNIIWDVTWNHHYNGWRGCLATLREHAEKLPNIDLVGCLDHAMVHRSIFENSWVGFLHNTPVHPPEIKETYSIFDLDLTRMLELDCWKQSIKKCERLFVFSNYTKQFIEKQTTVPISVLKHPTEFPAHTFNINDFLEKEKNLILVGHWMRNFQAIFDIKTSYKKSILVSEKFLNESIKRVYKTNDSVELIQWMPNEEYDNLLSTSVVFCPLFDCSACNGILDCIARNTPILLPRLPAAIEYLGENYPLFYENISEASYLIENDENIKAAYEHLTSMDKTDLTFAYFGKQFRRQFLKIL